nr:MAG TPA: hypothetical protein [Caudoviricetes sp.]
MALEFLVILVSNYSVTVALYSSKAVVFKNEN